MTATIKFDGTDAALVLTGVIESEARTAETWAMAGALSPQKNGQDIVPSSILDLVPDDGKWHHVVIVWNGGKSEGYVDGSRVAVQRSKVHMD